MNRDLGSVVSALQAWPLVPCGADACMVRIALSRHVHAVAYVNQGKCM